MNRVLIYTDADHELAEQMKIFMETRLPYEVSLSEDKAIVEETITQKPVHLLIYETKDFNEENMQYLLDLRSLGFGHPFLVVAEKLRVPNFLANVDRFKTLYLPKPFEFKALRGVTQKLVLARTIPQQMHRRFKTQQSAILEAYSSGEAHSTELFNLSVGGAYLEFSDSKPRVGVGELVRFRVNLSDVEKEHNMNARVVWTTRKGGHHGGFGCGLRFIKGNDIYRQLIDKG